MRRSASASSARGGGRSGTAWRRDGLPPDRRTAERPAFATGQEMWDWVLYGNPIPGMLLAEFSEDQQQRIRLVLDGMIRERAGVSGKAILTNVIHIGIGTK